MRMVPIAVSTPSNRASARLFVFLASGSALTLLLAGCGKVDLAWSEEVVLADGRMLIVDRTAQGKKFSELGGPGGWDQADMSLAVVELPDGVRPPPPWRDAYAPVLLDYEPATGSWSLLATFYYCQTWYALGRPIPPYIQYRSADGSAWTRVPLEDRFIERKTNLLTGPSSDGEPDLVSATAKEKIERSSAVRFQRILRKWGLAEENHCDRS